MSSIIQVENLSKSYKIRHQTGERYSTLRETLSHKARRLFGKTTDTENNSTEEFWALKDVSFDIQQGEVLGVIGRNGAGKSTLLKILSRITEPTKGRITLKGRVASLLEIGTGFHPELTGRENIFLNGAILGMSRAEIKAQFDAIVDFAEIEKFLDTPIKRYSSGMHVRLAFAVAAHLQSEILIVDEVLAVGDSQFQKKCLGKMEEVGSNGKTVLFVSHSMPTINRLCRRSVLLKNGEVRYIGDVATASVRYLDEGYAGRETATWQNNVSLDNTVRLHSARILNQDLNPSGVLSIHEPLFIEVEYEQLKDNLKKPLTISIHIIDGLGNTLLVTNDFLNAHWYEEPRRKGIVKAQCRIESDLLNTGYYFATIAICSYSPDTIHLIEREALSFQTYEESEKSGYRTEYNGDWPGITRLKASWRASYI